MKFQYLVVLVFTSLIACQKSADIDNSNGIDISLEEFNYFENDIPFQITAYSQDESHDKIAALGRILFYDTRLSQNNSIACASCHKQDLGFADSERFSAGVRGYMTSRNAMSLANNAYQKSHFWEGHTGDIDDHVLNPISNHIEMGMRDINELVEKLSEITNYNNLFNEVYGQSISKELITNAMSTFVASIISYKSKFDKGKEINFVNFTLSEQAGKDLFFGKAFCGECHQGDHFSAKWRNRTNIGLDKVYQDQGAGKGHFKVPSLRNIALTSPYMHDGRFETLEEVVDHYVHGIIDTPELDWDLRSPINLNSNEKEQLIDFLHTLTDFEVVSNEKFSNPF